MIWMDGEYGLIKWKQQNTFDGKHSDLAFANPDLESWAGSYGAWGRTLETADALAPTLEEAFRQKGPAIVGVPIDYRENRKLTKRLGEIEFTI